MSNGTVVAVFANPIHALSKPNLPSITLVAGLGADGDAHSGETVKHRSRVARDPTQANLRQIHLIHSELHEALRGQGFSIDPGQMGENITTSGVNLLSLAKGAILRIGQKAIVEVTAYETHVLSWRKSRRVSCRPHWIEIMTGISYVRPE